MSIRRLALILLAGLPLVLVGCKIRTINYFPPHPADVRTANFVIGAATLDVSVNGSLTWPALPFQSTTPYQEFNNERTTFSMQIPGATSDLASAQYDLAGNTSYTLLAYGTTTAAGFLALPDTGSSPSDGRFQARVANIAPIGTNVDVYLTTPDQSIDGTSPRFSNIGYATATAYLEFDAGSLRLRVTPSGSKAAIYDSGAVSFSAGLTTDLVVYGTGSGTLVGVASLAVNAPPQDLPSTLARFRAVNAGPQAGTVNVLLDGSALNSGVTYPSAAAYNTVPAGSHTIAFEAAATPGAILASVTTPLAPASDTSIFLAGNAGANSATVLTDTNLATTDVRVRFVNASPDAPALQILANDTVVAGSLGSNAASGYSTLAAGNYNVTIRNAATGAVLQTVNGITLSSGQTNTIYVVGPASTLALLVAIDRQ